MEFLTKKGVKEVMCWNPEFFLRAVELQLYEDPYLPHDFRMVLTR